TEPSVAVTGNALPPPAAAVGGPAIMPIARGDGALIQITRSPALCAAIDVLPVSEPAEALSIRSKTVSASSPGFSTGIESLLVADQSQASAPGLKTTAGRPSGAKTTRSFSPSQGSRDAFVVSTMGVSAPPTADSSSRAN